MKKQLSKSDIKDLIKEVKDTYNYEVMFTHKAKVELVDDTFYYVNDELEWFRLEGQLLPHIRILHKHNFLKTVTVDMGAIKFVTSGADIFRPGIVAFEGDIEAGEVVAIKDETHGKILAIGSASGTTQEMEAKEGGKVIMSLHYVGDEIWSL
ncbi:MAG: DUF1947 domain-containing protein [Candidatus Nanoarchaeia archaeon]